VLANKAANVSLPPWLTPKGGAGFSGPAFEGIGAPMALASSPATSSGTGGTGLLGNLSPGVVPPSEADTQRTPSTGGRSQGVGPGPDTSWLDGVPVDQRGQAKAQDYVNSEKSQQYRLIKKALSGDTK
ncbi:MAG TPA: hypothetical protein VMK12_03850, partial [Anaeromyxobacteraceae bacterium]|nr:hypothetical protein [Anaeromyxobacteraceae bacterium]